MIHLCHVLIIQILCRKKENLVVGLPMQPPLQDKETPSSVCFIGEVKKKEKVDASKEGVKRIKKEASTKKGGT